MSIIAESQHRTVEFKLMATCSQVEILESWRDSQRWVWNEGLGLLMEYESINRAKFYALALSDPTHKSVTTYRTKRLELEATTPCDPSGIEFRLLRLDRKGLGSVCQIATGKGKDYRPCSPIKIQERLKYPNYMGLTGYITKGRYPHARALEGVPMVWVAGTLKSLAESWKAFKDGKRAMAQIPKFKSKKRGDKIRSLYCGQPTSVRIEGDRIFLPGSSVLGGLKVVNHQLAKRWHGEKCTARIVFKASGLYLQLIGEVPAVAPKESPRACGLDVGLEFLYSDDAGKQVKPEKHYRTQEKRLARLQRRLSRQTPGGANHGKTQQAIALLHEQIAARRKSYNHKLSTYVVRTYGAIAVEDIQIANLMRRAKPKKREDSKGYERNGAAAKSGLSKSFADAGLGQLLTMIETKAAAADREFVKVPPQYTSQECPECGSLHKKALSQRTHRCIECGHTEPRDTAAARVIRERADFARSYRPWGREVKPVDLARVQGMKQESEQSEPSGVVAPTYTTTQPIEEVGSKEGVAPCPVPVSADPPPRSKLKTRKKQNPSQTGQRSYVQLGLWEPGAQWS
jgi:putative transposase